MQNIEIQKWGNSAAIRLNKGLLQQLSCEVGSQVEAVIQEGGIFLKPVKVPEFTLEELMATCTEENTRLDKEDSSWLSAKPVGKEVL